MTEQDEHPERSIAEQLEINRRHLEGLRHQLAEENRASAAQLDAIRLELGEAVRDRERLRRELTFSRRAVIVAVLVITIIDLLIELLSHL